LSVEIPDLDVTVIIMSSKESSISVPAELYLATDEKTIAAASDLQRSNLETNSGENAIADTAPIEYPNAFKLTLLLVATALSVFIVSLDTTIVSTAIPRITEEFHSLEDEAWYVQHSRVALENSPPPVLLADPHDRSGMAPASS
jgi:hypothetical protein